MTILIQYEMESEGSMILIKNAKVYTITGKTLENTDILVEKGKIREIKKGIAAKKGAQVIDATDRLVFPGFIDAHCHVGMWEEGMGFEGSDGNETTDPVTPQLRAIDAINPMDEGFTNALSGGVTTIATGPGSANVVGGYFCVMKTAGHRVDDMVLDAQYAMKCAFGENPKRVYNGKGQTPSTRMGTAFKLREILFKAQEYQKKIKAAKGDASKMPAFDMKLEALLPVLEKKIPLKAHAHRADDIFTSIRIAKEFGVHLTLEHCTEGHLIAEDLAKEGYPAIVGPSFGNKSKIELNQKSFETVGVLERAGVKVAIMTDAPVIPIENLVTCAALAHKAGMSEEAALRAITIAPAEILRQDKRLGSIEVGKDADLVIWDRHPFDLQARALYTLVDGEIVHQYGAE